MAESGGGKAIARKVFPKKDRVRLRSEIDRVFKEGAKFSCKGMRLHVHGNGLALNRVVFIPVRSYPGAVARNRAKRILRESWRLLKDRFVSHGQDFVIVLYPGMDSYEERSAQLLRLLRQAGIVGAAR